MDGSDKKLLDVVQADDSVSVVKLLPKQILDEVQISEIGQSLKDLISGGCNKLVLDFSRVDHFSSSALGMLITTKKDIEASKGDMKLCYIQPQIFKVFKITRLDKVFSIYKTIDDALAGFKE